MRLKRFLDGMARTRSGLWVLSGLTAVLSGVEKVMIVSLQAPARTSAARVKVETTVQMSARRPRTDYFTIRQTRSEFGYVYWVLQGHGYFQSFALFDTWAEAMAQADERLRTAWALAQEEREVAYQ